MIVGLGPETPVVENVAGGRQSALPYRFDLIDALAIFRLARVLAYGAERYEPNNWRKIPVDDHLNHAVAHIYAYLGGDTQDDHLGHAFCRLMMGLALALGEQPETRPANHPNVPPESGRTLPKVLLALLEMLVTRLARR